MKAETKKKDGVWKNLVKDRDSYECQVCHNKNVAARGLQAHHILPRQFVDFRWDVKNGITLCSSCHKWSRFSAHQNALWFYLWLKSNKPIQFSYLMEKLDKLSTVNSFDH